MDGWSTLIAAGLPDGAAVAVPKGPIDLLRLRRGLLEVVNRLDEIEERRRDPLKAWLDGWRQHWPASFREVMGRPGEDAIARLRVWTTEPNRYLKLRRIAVENLSRLV